MSFMDLSKLTIDQALQAGVITHGKWNDSDWNIMEPEWKIALRLAEKYHLEAGNTYIDKSNNRLAGEKAPYIHFIKELLNVLVNEAHITSDDILTTAALYHILSMTTCEAEALARKISPEIVEDVKLLDTIADMEFGEQVKSLAVLEAIKGQYLNCIFLAAKLVEESRIDLCPFSSWEEDIPHYIQIGTELDQYGMEIYRSKQWNLAVLLGTKLLEQLEHNKQCSRYYNQTAEELYEGGQDSWN